MYNGGFGAYPQDDMGVNSYFGESDTNFFGDTSNDSFFGEGAGFDNGFNNCEMITEAMGFSTDGMEFFTESKGVPGYTSDGIPITQYPDTTKNIGERKKPDKSQHAEPKKQRSASGQWWTQHDIPEPTQPAGKSKGHNSYDTNDEAVDKNIDDAWDKYPDRDSFMKARAARVASVRKYRDDQDEKSRSGNNAHVRQHESNANAARGWMSTGSYMSDDTIKKSKEAASRNFKKD